ncbi:hypothetical protein [Lachnoclostridium sp. An118]|uniref:hypothetical protein n=1 Tax=Lachnoclostridium sp. An118 TaxID=1965547 RepID=UPI0013A65D21|nr:hypothetical protein [Lachnoclostridium sp. An118]
MKTDTERRTVSVQRTARAAVRALPAHRARRGRRENPAHRDRQGRRENPVLRGRQEGRIIF